MNLIREREREREREQRNLKPSLNSANAKNLGDLALDSSDSNATDSNDSKQYSNDSTPQTSLQNYKKLDYESLSDDEKSEGYVFHILSDFVSDDSRQKLDNLEKELSKIYPCRIEIHICDDSVFEGMPKWCGNYSAHYRLFISKFMPKNLKMCLYLDTDMLVVKDLREIFTLDLQEKILGVVMDSLKFSAFGLYAKNPQTMDIYFGDSYFNSGFLLINLFEWRKQNVTQESIKYLSNYFTIWHDQDALNGVCGKKILICPIQYNLFVLLYPKNKYKDFLYYHKSKWQHYSQQEIDFALANPIILHFGGIEKAWDFACNFVDLKDNIIDFYWWQVAWNTPFFSDELKVLFATKRDNYLVCKDFGLYIASLIDECSKRFVGYFKMPFVVYRAFSKFDLNRNYANDFSESLDRNVAFELLSVAVRAWGKKSKLERIAKFAVLPFRIYRTKNRCKNGIYKAQKGNVISRLYV